MDNKTQLNLITSYLDEIVGEEQISQIISNRPLKIYIGTATTGKPHIGYFVWVLKVSELLKAGCEVKILFADVHAYLDNMKSTWELLEYRIQYYQKIITKMLELSGADISKLTFVKGSDYQLDREYTLDMYRAAVNTTLRDAKKAGAEVVKQVDSPLLGAMLYPILQALDEEYLDVDAQLGGVDQRKIFMMARDLLPRMGYKKRIHLMSPMIPGLGKSGKMSSSEPHSKVDFDDSDEVIKDKFSKAFSIDKQVEGNGLMALAKYILFRFYADQDWQLEVSRPAKWGGDVSYATYPDLEVAFISGQISSVDLKPAIANEIIKIISPLRDVINQNQDLISKAYPQT